MFSVHSTLEKVEKATITCGRKATLDMVFIRLRQRNHIITATSLFFRMFSVHTRTQCPVVEFFRFVERFRKAPFSVHNFSRNWRSKDSNTYIKKKQTVLLNCNRTFLNSLLNILITEDEKSSFLSQCEF